MTAWLTFFYSHDYILILPALIVTLCIMLFATKNMIYKLCKLESICIAGLPFFTAHRFGFFPWVNGIRLVRAIGSWYPIPRHIVYDTSSTGISSKDISSTTAFQRIGQS